MSPHTRRSSLTVKKTPGRPSQGKKRESPHRTANGYGGPPLLHEAASPRQLYGRDAPVVPWGSLWPFLPQSTLNMLAELDSGGSYKVELVPPKPARLILTRTDRGRDSRPPPLWPAASAFPWAPWPNTRPVRTRESTQQTEPAGSANRSVALQTDVERTYATPRVEVGRVLDHTQLYGPGVSQFGTPLRATPQRLCPGRGGTASPFRPSSVSTPNSQLSRTVDSAGPSGLQADCSGTPLRSPPDTQQDD